MTDSADKPRPGGAQPPTIVVAGPMGRGAVANLCDQICGLLAGAAAAEVICDVSALNCADIETVDALSRLQLATRHAGGRVRLGHPSPRLLNLLDFAGLCDVLRTVRASADRNGRQTEQREEPVGVEERDH